MNKKILIVLVIAAVFILLFPLFRTEEKKNLSVDNNVIESNAVIENTINENRIDDSDMDMIFIKINNQVLDVKLENNSATQELRKKLTEGDVVINAREYGGFEKVGDMGFSLPREDSNMKTTSGDIVLYQGNQISVFYGSNSWSYTKLGKIQSVNSDELKNILGSGEVTLTLTLFNK